MTFETTLYIHYTILMKLDSAIEITNYRRTSLIMLLLKYAMNDYLLLEKQKCTVKYQPSDSLKKWKRVHVWFSDTEYVFCLDMRKFFRKSVSALLAYSVEKYLDIIIEKSLRKKASIQAEGDNYLFSKYKFKRVIKNTTIFWIQSWKKEQAGKTKRKKT